MTMTTSWQIYAMVWLPQDKRKSENKVARLVWDFDCLHFAQYILISPQGIDCKQTWCKKIFVSFVIIFCYFCLNFFFEKISFFFSFFFIENTYPLPLNIYWSLPMFGCQCCLKPEVWIPLGVCISEKPVQLLITTIS